jgi:hypothetical protein
MPVLFAATPIIPSDGDRCWAFHIVNDGSEPIESVVIESVDYEWGDYGNSETVSRGPMGPLAPHTSIEVLRETDTEVRTSVTFRVRDAAGERRYVAELGKLYRPVLSAALVEIPYLGRAGKLARLEVVG